MTFQRCTSIRHQRRPVRSPGGFTLIELLVAIGIVAILAAILVPVSGSMRTRAKAVECVSRLRQTGAALLLHAADHKNVINYKAGGAGGASNLWTYFVADYVSPGWKNGPVYRALDILYCPDYFPFKHDPENSTWAWAAYGGYFVQTAYVKSAKVTETSGDVWTSLQVNLVNLPTPGSYLMLIDSVTPDLKSQRMNITTHNGAAGVPSVHMRHAGKANAIFYDGHVKALDSAALKDIGFVRGFDKDLNSVSY